MKTTLWVPFYYQIPHHSHLKQLILEEKMFHTKKFLVFLLATMFMMVCGSLIAAQVSGFAYLNDSTDHSGIEVKFLADPATPSAITATTYTDASGAYNITITIGRYDVIYSKPNYLDQTYYDFLHTTSTTLPVQTLEYIGPVLHLNGPQSGTLVTGYSYIVESLISVEAGDSLTIEPGVTLYFKNNIGFNVNGALTAIGTAESPIVFTSLGSETRGEMNLNNSSINMQYCEFSNSTYGFTVLSNQYVNASPYIAHSKIYNNTIGAYFRSYGNAHVEYCEFFNNHDTVLLIQTSRGGAIIEHNEIYNNQLTNSVMTLRGEDGWCGANVSFNHIFNNQSNGVLLRQGLGSVLTFEGNIIENNSSLSYIFYSYRESIDLSYGNILNNVFRYNDGVDLYLQEYGEMTKNLIYGNSGSVVFAGSGWGPLVSRNNTIIANTGNGLVVGNYNCYVSNNLVAFNGGYEVIVNIIPQLLGHNLFYDTVGDVSQNNASFPLLLDLLAMNANGTPCDAYYNISSDPLLVDLLNGNLYLMPASPCINAGDPSLPLDPNGSVSDIGALYYDSFPPTVDFIADVVSGYAPLQVNFTDLSVAGSGIITNWLWDFGDGYTSIEQNPQHIYSVEGVYTVSLTVTNSIDSTATYTRSEYITALPRNPQIEVSKSLLNFGNVYLGSQSYEMGLWVRNIGGADLTVSGLSFYTNPSQFQVLVAVIPFIIAPSDSSYLSLQFIPQYAGSVTDSLYIHSDAVNVVSLAVGLRGNGEYVPPKPPENVAIVMDGYDAVISWDAVTQTIFDTPITPDFYLVFFNGSSDPEPDSEYYFLGISPTLSYTHLDVGQFSPHMFYRVRAYVNYENRYEDISDLGIVKGMPEEEVIRRLHNK